MAAAQDADGNALSAKYTFAANGGAAVRGTAVTAGAAANSDVVKDLTYVRAATANQNITDASAKAPAPEL